MTTTAMTVKPHEALEAILDILGCDRDEASGRFAELMATPEPLTTGLPAPQWIGRHRRNLHRGATIATRTRTFERRAKVWEMRKLSMSIDQIAKQIGVSKTTVSDDLKWWFANLAPRDVEERRSMELESIDQMTNVVARLAVRGDLDAMREWRALRKMHQDVSGVTRVAPTIVVGPSPEQWGELIDAVAGIPAPVVIDVDSEELDEILGELEAGE